jgi:ornithine cyclodeaminase/alanine dehydrogenase-like protein (mu-crystallin family)
VTKSDDLVEQQILEHEAHLKRIDELFEKAREVHGAGEERDALLAALEDERDTLAELLHRMRGDSSESWEKASELHFGPLAIWEALARVLERAIEKRESGSPS